MSGSLAFFGTIVVSFIALVTSVITLLFGRKEKQAQTNNINVKTELEHIGGLRQEIGALQATVRDQGKELDALQRRERIQRRLLARHEIWDIRAVDALASKVINLPSPPSLDVDEATDANGPRTRSDDYENQRRTDR